MYVLAYRKNSAQDSIAGHRTQDSEQEMKPRIWTQYLAQGRGIHRLTKYLEYSKDVKKSWTGQEDREL